MAAAPTLTPSSSRAVQEPRRPGAAPSRSRAVLENNAPTYMNSIARFAQALEVETLIPAHNPISGPELLGGYMQYLNDVTQAVRGDVSAGWTLAETMDRIPFALDRPYSPPEDHPRIGYFRDLHSYNVMKTHQSFTE